MQRPPLSVLARACRRLSARLRSQNVPEGGITTAEYSVGSIAACGFAGVLYKAITSAEVLAAVKHVVVRAFQQAF